MAQGLASETGNAAIQGSSAPTAPFVLSLIAGALILAGAWMMAAFGFGGSYGMMGSYYGMMGGFGYGGWLFGAAAVGVISGIAVLVGAVMIYTRPRSTATWGLVVLVFSVLSFFGMGGFFVGAVLGIIGGALALASKPEVASR